MTPHENGPSVPETDPEPLPIVVCFAGPSDSGKTTLVESLVAKLTETHRVATVKSIHHDIEPDTPGTDTHRHRTSGADTVVGITPSHTFEVTPGGKGTEDSTDPDRSREHAALARVVRRLAAREYDIVIVEGYASAPLPTVAVGDPPADAIAGEIIATGEAELDELVRIIEGLEAPEAFVSAALETEQT